MPDDIPEAGEDWFKRARLKLPDIKPCPFCGAPGKVEESEGVRGVVFSVGCTSTSEADCMGYQSFTVFNTAHEAIAAWNKRAP